MKKILLLWGCAAVLTAASCSDSKVCRCIYDDGGKTDEYFEADENEDCRSAGGVGVTCYEE